MCFALLNYTIIDKQSQCFKSTFHFTTHDKIQRITNQGNPSFIIQLLFTMYINSCNLLLYAYDFLIAHCSNNKSIQKSHIRLNSNMTFSF